MIDCKSKTHAKSIFACVLLFSILYSISEYRSAYVVFFFFSTKESLPSVPREILL